VVTIKGKILLLALILIIASVSVTAYHVTPSNSQLGQANVPNLNHANNSSKDNSKNEVSAASIKSDTCLKSYSNSPKQSNYNNNKKSSTKKTTYSKSDVKTSDAQAIARKYIEEPGAVAGKPETYDIGGKTTYVVPVLIKGKTVGEIDIDPKTGKNVGGAGGAPN